MKTIGIIALAYLLMTATAALCPASVANAAAPAQSGANTSGTDGPDKAAVVALVTAQAATKMPADERIAGLELMCEVPDKIEAVEAAPGMDSITTPSFMVTLRTASGKQLTCPVSARIERQVLVARRALARGQVVRPEDFEPVWRDALRFPSAAPRIEGAMVLRTALPKGGVLNEFAVEKATLVRAGDSVTLTVKNHAIAVTGRYRALGDGGEGDGVELRNPDTDRIVHATVTGRGRAELDIEE